jgi:ABC-type amino acid transport substrate-binding protein
MKQRWLALALAVAAGCCFAQSPTIDKMRKTGVMSIGYIDGALPFSYLERGVAKGYSIDICDRVANELRRSLKLPNLKTAWVPLTVQNRLEAVRKGQVDLECSTTSLTLSRQEAVDFSLTIFVDGASIMVRKADPFARLGDFSGQRIAVISKTTTEQRMSGVLAKTLTDAQLVPVQTREEGLGLLARKEVSGFAADRTTLIGAAVTSGSPGSWRLLDDIYSVEPYALALRRGDADFRLAVNRALAGLYRDGGIAEVYNKWFGQFGEPPPLLAALYLLNSLSE